VELVVIVAMVVLVLLLTTVVEEAQDLEVLPVVVDPVLPTQPEVVVE
jgi:hypothetical protein